VKATNGTPLAANYTWRFQTSSPHVSGTSPTSATSPQIAQTTQSGLSSESGMSIESATMGTGNPKSDSMAVQASPWTPVRVAFSEAMDPATITSTSFKLTDSSGSTVSGTITYDASANTAILTPSSLLKYDATYTATVTTTITATDGAPLDAGVTWQFHTALMGTPVGIDAGTDPYSFYLASTGAFFLPDGYVNGMVTGGTVSSPAATIGNTVDPYLYSTERDGVFTYQVPVPAGNYDIRLHFADTTSTAIGQRVFSVDVTDTATSPDIANLDIFKEVGQNAADVKTLSNVAASSSNGRTGSLTIKTIAGTGTPLLSAIELVPLPPTISSTSPTNNATGVSRTASIKATFAWPMDPTTISTSTVTIKDAAGNAVAASVTFNTSTRVLTLTPSVSLAASTNYTVTLDKSIEALTGMQLGTSYSWTFKTGTK
jgi:hypothetical protein